jgi:hypothetical protein
MKNKISTKQEMVHFREYTGIMRAVRKHAKAKDLTVSHILRRALRKYLLDSNKIDATLIT